MIYFAVYLAVISAISVIETVIDKRTAAANAASQVKMQRVPERRLLLLAAMGGSLAMYVTMRIIRHKTRHMKFMIGLPVIFVLQVVLVILFIYPGVLI